MHFYNSSYKRKFIYRVSNVSHKHSVLLKHQPTYMLMLLSRSMSNYKHSRLQMRQQIFHCSLVPQHLNFSWCEFIWIWNFHWITAIHCYKCEFHLFPFCVWFNLVFIIRLFNTLYWFMGFRNGIVLGPWPC